MKSYLRFLSRNKMYTAIEVVGLSVALAFVVFIATFVAGELGYDKELKNTDNIYVGHETEFSIMSYTVGDLLVESFPEIEDICRFLSTSVLGGVAMEATVGGETFPQNAIIADENFFKFFTFPFVEGSREEAFNEKDAVVISESFANLHFPDESPLGQVIEITVGEEKRNLVVKGVCKDIERSVFPAAEIIYRTDVVKDLHPSLIAQGNGTSVSFYRLAQGTDIAALQEKALEKLKKGDILFRVGLMKEFIFSPFSQIHYGVSQMHAPFVGRINLNFIKLFIAAGILLLVFAVLNYISLTVAQIGFRAREMATRRLLGEQKWEIVSRYIKEAFLLTLLSFALALLFIKAFAPYGKILLEKEVDLLANLTPGVVVLMALFVFLLSFVAGVVPALLVSKYRPVDVVKGEFAAKGRMVLGKSFICVQNVVAIATLCVAFAMFFQFKHLLDRDCGYTKDGIITVSGAQRGSEYFVDELKQLPFVEKVGWVQSAPSETARVGMSATYKGEQVQLELIYGDTTAFDILGFKVLSVNGSVNRNNGSYWLTEGAMKALEVDYNTESVVFGNQAQNAARNICGIIKNFQRGNRSYEDCASSNIIWENKVFSEDNFGYLRTLVIKVHGDEDEAVAALEKFYEKNIPANNLRINSQNAIYRQYFSSEENNLKLIVIFTILVMMLSAMAMLAMSTYFARQQARNWSLRKVFGCSRQLVFGSMVCQFLKVVLLAAAVAVPLGYYIVGEWLSGYSYRIGNHWWLYALALLLAVTVSFAAISWQVLRLMNSNPVEELRKNN